MNNIFHGPMECVPDTRRHDGDIDCDRKAWISDDIYKAIIAAIRLKECHLDTGVFDRAIEGIVQGTLLEIANHINFSVYEDK